MKHSQRRFLAGSAMALALASPALAQAPPQADEPQADQPQAQQAAPQPQDEQPQAAESSRFDVVTVTARRVEEDIQRTPVAISALSMEGLEKAQLTNVSQLQNSTPSLTISNAVAQPGSATVFIRGQGSSDGLIAIDQAIGVYVNGVYSARSTGGAFEMVDMQRVEILRGPQGTLFGRNTTGGAINLIPQEPTDQFEASLRLDYGNFDTFLARGVLNIPGDGMDVRVAVQHREHSGYGRNLFLNREVGGEESDYIRLSAKIDPSDALSILLQGDYHEFDSSGQFSGLKSFTPTSTNQLLIDTCNGAVAAYPPPFNGLAALRPFCPFGRAGDTYANYVQGQGIADFWDTFTNTPAYGKVDAYGFTGTVSYELSPNLAFKSITSWRGTEMAALTDNDGTPYILSGGVRPTDGNFIEQDQFSQEFQLTGAALSDRLDWIVGAFFFEEEGTDRSFSGSVFPVSASLGIVDGTINNQSVAGYGQVTYSLTDTVRLTAGARYTRDTREMVIRNRDQNLLSGVVTPSFSPRDGDPNDPFRASFEEDFDYWSYTLGADWQATRDIFFYAKTSRAQRSGGFNTRAVTGGLPPVSFQPEEVTDYEIGGKLDLFNGLARLNAAAFYADYQDVQRNLIGVAAGNRLVSGVDNAAAAHITGGEIELTVAPTSNLTLAASAGFTNPEYDEFINSIDGADMSDTPFIYTPEETYTASVDYDLPVGSAATINFHVDYSYRTEAYAVPLKNPAFTPAQNAALQDTALIPAYGLLNARIALALEDSNVEIALYGKNLTEEEYYTRLLGLEGTALGVTSYGAGDPMTYGVSLTYRY